MEILNAAADIMGGELVFRKSLSSHDDLWKTVLPVMYNRLIIYPIYL